MVITINDRLASGDGKGQKMRAMNDLITLISVKKEPDRNALQAEVEVDRLEVFADIRSVKRSEYYEADRAGVKLALSVYIHADDYGAITKPSLVEYMGTKYRIYRTYQETDLSIELVLQEVE